MEGEEEKMTKKHTDCSPGWWIEGGCHEMQNYSAHETNAAAR